MHRVTFEGQTVEVPHGSRLRDGLHAAGATPHNGNSRWFNCQGFGTCGTCAVRVDGEVSPMSGRERARLNFPPHNVDDGLRLACQVRVHGDVHVTKYEGFWGQTTAAPR